MKTQSPQFLRKRKFLLVLPLLVLPFVTLTFWALGGGKDSGKTDAQQQKQGLNTALPGAQFSKEQSLDKMSLYDQATKDSLALKEQLMNDPYAKTDSLDVATEDSVFAGHIEEFSAGSSGTGLKTETDPNEARIKKRLEQLDRTINQPLPSGDPLYNGSPYPSGAPMGGDLDRLQAMMQTVGQPGASDPELQQLNSLLEKVMDVQNPARAQEKLRQQSQKNKGRVYSVGKVTDNAEAGVFGGGAAGDRDIGLAPVANGQNRFYDLEERVPDADPLLQSALPAVIHETQTLVAGATVKMRLTEAVFINGIFIPAGTFISGNCSIERERLRIDVGTIRYGKNLFPVSLACYDLDGLEGIRVPGAITRDAAKEGTDRAIQSLQLMTLDPPMAAQAASAGVEALKGLFGKKAKLIRVTVKAGHPILLLDQKAMQELN